MREPAGQSVMWPHVHFMPRKKGDIEGFPGSVRFAVRNGRGPAYYLNHPDFKEEYTEHQHVIDEEASYEMSKTFCIAP